jgi:signal transduction histidine kinase
MVPGVLRRGIDGLAGRARALPKLSGRMRRPAIFGLYFWSVLVLVCASYALGPGREEGWFGALPVVLSVAALVAAWAALPWGSRVSGLRKLAAPAFLAGTLALGYFAGSVWSIGLYAISFANGVFLFGFVWGTVYAAAVLPVIFANYVLLLATLYPARDTIPSALVLTAAWVPAAVIVIGICATIAEAVRRKEEAQDLLAKLRSAHAELEDYAGRVRELSISEERARMAREIHDSIGHHLTVVNLQLQNAERFRDTKPENAWTEVEDARKAILEALAEVRRSVRALGPPDLEKGSSAGAIRALVRTFEGTDIRTSFELAGEEREVSGEAGLVLYRAAQEGLTNAAKHSDARHVALTLSFTEGNVGLVVADDGAGAAEEAKNRGFGLASLRRRVEALGGAFSAGNRPGGGFALEVKLPRAGGS